MRAGGVVVNTVILWACILATGLPVKGARQLQDVQSIYTVARAPGPDSLLTGAASTVQGPVSNLGRKLQQDFGVPVPPAEAPVPASLIGTGSAPTPSVGQAVRGTVGRRLQAYTSLPEATNLSPALAPGPGLSVGGVGSTELAGGVNNLVGRRLQVDYGAPGPGLLGNGIGAPVPAPAAGTIGGAFENVGNAIQNGAQSVGQGIRNTFG